MAVSHNAAPQPRRILSLWLPRFATERRGLEKPDGRPLALTRVERGRLVLTAVDAHATGLGLEPGMALADARAMEPGLVGVEWSREEDSTLLRDLARWCLRYTPLVSLDPSSSCLSGTLGGDAGLWLDVTGCAHLFGGEEAMVADLVNRLTGLGLTAHAALAGTPGAAWTVAHLAAHLTAPAKGWCVVPDGRERAVIQGLPTVALRLSTADVEALERMGLRTVGSLMDLPRGPLTARFGVEPGRRIDQALGHLREPITPLAPPAPHRVRFGVPEPIADRQDLAHGVRRLLARICERLERERAGVRRLRIDFFRADGTTRSLSLSTGRPVRDADALFRLIDEKLDHLDPGFGVDVMVLEGEWVETTADQQRDLVGGPATGRDDEAVSTLLDRLTNRLGPDRVSRPLPAQSHLPERAEVRAPAHDRTSWKSATAPQIPRPVRLLSRPEPVDAIALLPDHPPAKFRWRGVDYRVARAAGPERLAPEWWRAEGDHTRDHTRDYFRVEDSEGRRFWLYRQGLVERGQVPSWMMHGLMA
jgi:protein ImuB